jgi:uncharacterized RDD family membrane protein YckC
MTSTIPTYAPPGVWRRFIAMSYDAMLLIALSFGYGGIVLLGRNWLFGIDPTQAPGAIFQIGWLLLIAGFYIYFWQHGGQTLGMRAWRIQLVNKSGAPLSFQQSLIRCLVAPFSLAFGGLGYWWAFWDKDGQTWHDRASKSFVIQLPKKLARDDNRSHFHFLYMNEIKQPPDAVVFHEGDYCNEDRNNKCLLDCNLNSK